MKRVKLGEITTSNLGKMLDAKKNKGELQPYLANINVRWGEFDLNNLSQMRFLDSEKEKYELLPGDLVVCEGGEPGRCAIWERQSPNMKIQKALHRVRPTQETDIYYIYYWLLNAGQKGQLEKYFTGSTIKHLPGDKLKEIVLDIPDKESQNRIGHLLNSIDQKIKKNKQINDNLFAMSRAIYLHSFFGKKENTKISDVLLENKKSSIQVGEAKVTQGNYPFFTSGTAIYEWPEYLVEGKNIYLNTGGNADVKYYVGKAAYSTDTWCISAKNDLTDYLYLLLASIKPELDQKFFQGTGLKHLQKPLIKDRKIYLPSTDELATFNSQVSQILVKISMNTRENQNLADLRDWLLPMLMNGQAVIST